MNLTEPAAKEIDHMNISPAELDYRAKELVAPILNSTNWTLIIAGLLMIGFLPFIARSFVKARRAIKEEQSR
jgi:hypothetical protein